MTKKTKTKNLLVFGVDASVNSTAITVFSCRRALQGSGAGWLRLKVLGTKLFSVPESEKKASLSYKLVRMRAVVKNVFWWLTHIKKLCQDLYGDDLKVAAALEGYAYQGKGKVFDIAEMTGAIKLCLDDVCDCWGIMPPGTWKSIALGNGKLRKDLVNKECYKLYGFENSQQDIVDSFLIGLAFIRALVGVEKARSWFKNFENNVTGDFSSLGSYYMRGWTFSITDKFVGKHMKRNVYDKQQKISTMKKRIRDLTALTGASGSSDSSCKLSVKMPLKSILKS